MSVISIKHYFLKFQTLLYASQITDVWYQASFVISCFPQIHFSIR